MSWDRDYCAECGSTTGCCHFTPKSVRAEREKAGEQAEEARKEVLKTAEYLLFLVDTKPEKLYPGQDTDLLRGTLESLRKQVTAAKELQEKADQWP